MKFRPILFSTPMVQAIISGSKVQTRRVIKPQPVLGNGDWDSRNIKQVEGKFVPFMQHTEHKSIKYKIGDVLWVRESHFQYGMWMKNGKTKTGKQKWKFVKDKALTSVAYMDNPPKEVLKNSNREVLGWFKRSSLFMPKEACRLFLKIKNIRVERLQDISQRDCFEEGIEVTELGCRNYDKSYPVKEFIGGGTEAIRSFKSLWQYINGEESWNSNPWVWVIQFERIDKPENFC